MIGRFRSHIRPVRAMLGAGLAASVLAAVMQWLIPWPLKFIFDSVLGHRTLPSWLHWMPHQRSGLLVAMMLAMIAIAAALAVSDYFSTRLMATAGQRVVLNIRRELFDHLEAQSPQFHQSRRTGDLLARLGGDVQAIQSAVINAVPTLVRNVLTLTGMIAIMLIVDWRFALLAMTLVPLLLWATHHYLARIKAYQRLTRRSDGDANAVAQEVLNAMTVVQAFGAEAVEAARYGEATERGLEQNRRAIVAQSQFTPLMTLAMSLSTAMVLYFGARDVIAGSLTAGDLLVFTAYLRGMYSPVRQLSKLAGVVGRAHAAAERVVELLDTHEEVPEVPEPRHLARVRGEIVLADVSVAYPGGTPVISGVSLHLDPGTRLALVGTTGSGKSTLVRLLPRFLDPTSGAVYLDGVKLTDLALADLRRQIAYVPQEPYLFRAPVWENIVYGSVELGRTGAIGAARRAGLHELIESFPQGYDTLASERGQSLSGGQRQCIAIARAMARNAPILLLDEPMTGLDAELESTVLGAIDLVAAGRTSIIVSHQLSRLGAVDHIAVVSDGRIDESGTHAQLMNQRRLYWRLRRLQADELASPAVPRETAHAHQLVKGEA
ncbi:MAG: ABC transporter ATP-binding protein [Actinomycetales bacterium]|nr:ABC transporter ATP-binding protein [Actinomycetales bacterium]